MSTSKKDILENLDEIIENLNNFLKFYENEKRNFQNEFTLEGNNIYFYNETLKDIKNSDRLDMKFIESSSDYLEWIKATKISNLTSNQSKFAKMLLSNRNIIQIGSFNEIYKSIMKYIKS